MVREIKHVNSSKKYIIPNCRASGGKKELNVQADIKTKNRRNLKVKALVDSGCTHTGIDEQLVKEKKIQMKAIDFSFEVFNADGTKNGEVTRMVSRSLKEDLIFIYPFHFHFTFIFIFNLFLELGLGLSDKDHTVT